MFKDNGKGTFIPTVSGWLGIIIMFLTLLGTYSGVAIAMFKADEAYNRVEAVIQNQTNIRAIQERLQTVDKKIDKITDMLDIKLDIK